MKRFLYSIFIAGMALFPLPLKSQVFLPLVEIPVFTENVFICKNAELDLEVYRGNDETRTVGILIYKREKTGIALIEIVQKQHNEWQVVHHFFSSKPELEDYFGTYSDEELLEAFFPDEILNTMTKKLQTNKCEQEVFLRPLGVFFVSTSLPQIFGRRTSKYLI